MFEPAGPQIDKCVDMWSQWPTHSIYLLLYICLRNTLHPLYIHLLTNTYIFCQHA